MREGSSSERTVGGTHFEADEATDDGSRRHWAVVLALLVSLLLLPWGLIALSSTGIVSGSIELPFRDAFLVVPLVPSIGLGLIAVWSAVAARRSE